LQHKPNILEASMLFFYKILLK